MMQTVSGNVQALNGGKRPTLLMVAATALEVAPLMKAATLLFETQTQTGRRLMALAWPHPKTDASVFNNSHVGPPETTKNENNSGDGVTSLPHNDGMAFWLIITGVGTINAAHAVTQAIEQCKPDRIIQMGIGGAFESTGIDVGDLAVATSDTDIHVGVEKRSYPHGPLPFDLVEGLPETRHGRFHFDPALCGKTHEILIRYAHESPRPAPRVIQGDFITVSTLTVTPERVKALETAFSPCMESMEGSAVAQVAALYKIPLIQIRAASNRVGIRDKSQWNIPLAVRRVCDAVMEFASSARNSLPATAGWI